MRRAILIFGVALLLVPSLALASTDISTISQAVPAGPEQSPASEAVPFFAFSTMDCLQIEHAGGSLFDAPDVLTDFDTAGWVQNWGTPTGAQGGGPSAGLVGFNINFVSLVDGTSFFAAGYDGGALVFSTQVTYDANIGGFDVIGAQYDPKAAVPEPGTWLALLAGMGVLGVVRLRS